MKIPLPLIFIGTYLIGLGLESSLPIRVNFFVSPVFLKVVGSVLFLFGSVLAGWCFLILLRAKTSAIPGQRSTTLISWGPYGMSRNPMYLGIIFLYLGLAFFFMQLFPIILLVLPVMYLQRGIIPLEEARLQEVFGEAYSDYCRHVGRWL